MQTGTEKRPESQNPALPANSFNRYVANSLDELLVLVELLQVLDGVVLELDELCSVNVGGIGKNADGHARSGYVGELDGTRETLVTLGLHVEHSVSAMLCLQITPRRTS